MKNSLKFLTLTLLILLAQLSLAASYVEGSGSEGHSQEVVAVGISYTDEDGVLHKNEAGNPAEPTEKYYASAIGVGNKATGWQSTAFGAINTASGWKSSAFGNDNTASRERSSAFGFKNTASGILSSAFGFLNKANGELSSAFGYVNTASGWGSSAFGNQNIASQEDSSAFGFKNTASDQRSTAFGYLNTANGWGSSAFGNQNTSSGRESSAFGTLTYVSGTNSGAFGRGKYSSGDYQYKIEGNNSWAIGSYNKIAAGSDNNHILGNNVSIGTSSETIIDSVVLGNESTVEESQVVSVGSDTKRRKIVHLAAGTNDTDAVNKKQMEDAIAAASLGGGGVVDAYTKAQTDAKLNVKAQKDGSNLSATDIAAWKAKLGVATVNSVANTASGTNSTGLGHGNVVTGNESTAVGYKNQVSGNNSGAFGDPNIVTGNRSYAFGNDNTIAGDDNFVMGSNVNIAAGITNSVALGNNSAVTSSNEVSVGSATLKRKITNVADGELSATSTDAVTGKQLYNVMQNSGTIGIQNLRKEVREAKDEMRGIGSLSAALSALHPMQYDPQAPNQIMAGVGTYRNKHAIAVGLTHYFKENVMMTAGVALSNERKTNAMANVGLTWKLGKGGSSSATNTPAYIVQDEMSRLTRENNQLKAQVNSQALELKEIKEQLKFLLEKK
ncbi:YadA-like family protein [Fusobacterium russii]|uniref:YadA-like family protein n=1 Tax=Fusobacterium russii TaxID=854 RepID=UPI00039BDD1D|nr:YadA-like family protein [Fusobacterium russii]